MSIYNKRRGKALCYRKVTELDQMAAYLGFSNYDVYHVTIPYKYDALGSKLTCKVNSYDPDCDVCTYRRAVTGLEKLAYGYKVGQQTLDALRRWLIPEEYKTLKACFPGRFS